MGVDLGATRLEAGPRSRRFRMGPVACGAPGREGVAPRVAPAREAGPPGALEGREGSAAPGAEALEPGAEA